MTLLKVHDLQQDLSHDFIKMAKNTLKAQGSKSNKQQMIYLNGQEMGFCNDDIRVLLEDLGAE